MLDFSVSHTFVAYILKQQYYKAIFKAFMFKHFKLEIVQRVGPNNCEIRVNFKILSWTFFFFFCLKF